METLLKALSGLGAKKTRLAPRWEWELAGLGQRDQCLRAGCMCYDLHSVLDDSLIYYCGLLSLHARSARYLDFLPNGTDSIRAAKSISNWEVKPIPRRSYPGPPGPLLNLPRLTPSGSRVALAETKAANAGVSQKELEGAINEAVGAVRSERFVD